MLEYLEVDWKSWMSMVATCAIFWIIHIIKANTKAGPGIEEHHIPVGDSLIPFTVFSYVVFFMCLTLYVVGREPGESWANSTRTNDLDGEKRYVLKLVD